MEQYIKQAEFLARGTEILPGGVEELAKKLEREADRKMLWKFQKDRTQKEDPKENAKNDSQ